MRMLFNGVGSVIDSQGRCVRSRVRVGVCDGGDGSDGGGDGELQRKQAPWP